ncbi:unnamed protein product, partial [Laminaria digitata]
SGGCSSNIGSSSSSSGSRSGRSARPHAPLPDASSNARPKHDDYDDDRPRSNRRSDSNDTAMSSAPPPAPARGDVDGGQGTEAAASARLDVNGGGDGRNAGLEPTQTGAVPAAEETLAGAESESESGKEIGAQDDALLRDKRGTRQSPHGARQKSHVSARANLAWKDPPKEVMDLAAAADESDGGERRGEVRKRKTRGGTDSAAAAAAAAAAAVDLVAVVDET